MSKRQLVLVVILLAAFWLRVHRLVELPPGLHYDEAANGTLAAGIAFDGYRPIFITSYTGKEVLFFYAAASIMRLIGESIFSLRLTSAFAGTLTVAAVYWLGREIEKKNRVLVSSLGLITAALLAISFPHLIFSRMGFRAIMQPLLQTVTVAAFLRGMNDSRYNNRWLIFSGIALGLTAYTYLAARLFPLLLGVLFLPLLRKWWRPIGITVGIAAIVLAPLGLFWSSHPETFWVRIGQVAGEYTFADYVNSYWRSLSMVIWQGDPYMRFNVPGRPIFPPYLAPLFLIGTLQLIWQTIKAQTSEQRALALFILTTPLIMILPTALALDEIVPSNLRAIGLFPFILFPIGFASVSLKKWLFSFSEMMSLRQAAILFAVYCLLFTISFRTYFTNWGTRTDNFYESDGDLVALAAFIDSRDEPIYVSSLHYQHPTLAFTSERYDEIKWVLESDAIVIPSHEALIAYPHSSPAPSHMASGQPIAHAATTDGAPLYTVYRLNEIAAFPVAVPLTANFSDVIRLNGYTFLDAETSTPTVRLFWQVIGKPSQDYTPFVHILDETGYRWAQAEANAYPSAQWEVGEVIVQDVTFDLPAGMPNAQFNLEIGLFAGIERLPLVNKEGQFAGSVLQVEDVLLAGNRGTVVEVGTPVVDGLMLADSQVGTKEIEAGTRLPLTIIWSADTPLPDLNYQITLGNTTIYQGQPARGQSPFASWQTPRMTIDRIDPLISADFATGQRPLQLTVYRGDESVFTIELDEVTVLSTVREFEQPGFEISADAMFGENIRLTGYTITADTIRLVWQAIAPPQNDYTAFVHILNPDGTCCVWQLDRIPRGDYATARWVAGEYIVDEYVTEGTGLIEIGLYDPKTGVRLLVQSSDAPTRDFYYLDFVPE